MFYFRYERRALPLMSQNGVKMQIVPTAHAVSSNHNILSNLEIYNFRLNSYKMPRFPYYACTVSKMFRELAFPDISGCINNYSTLLREANLEKSDLT